ncbi:MAG: hypothetical protein IJU69_00890 [Bacteroidales bacterium]|nr:hypothetical protein [Bacteroidales bacterium]
MKRSDIAIIFLLSLFCLGCFSCSPARKLRALKGGSVAANIMFARENDWIPSVSNSLLPKSDTLVVKDFEGNEVTIMKAVRDEKTGEMVASSTIRPAVVTARFRNVAERHGEVTLEFEIRVPALMLDPSWQTVFCPKMYLMGDTVHLEKLILSGEEFRRSQMRGYNRYRRFLNSIVTDSTLFVDYRNLEIFLHRNIPALYAMRSDSTVVSDEQWASVFGVSEKEAVDHYTDKWAKSRNARRLASRDKKYRKWIKVPLSNTGVRLDTVIRADSDFVFTYRQDVKCRPGLRKVEITVGGVINGADGASLYSIPDCSPLVFYISSLSSFSDTLPRYRVKIISRDAATASSYNIDFEKGRSEVQPSLSGNSAEIARIKSRLGVLLTDPVFELDSIMIYAYASPEGSEEHNYLLSGKRASSVSAYFSAYLGSLRDSLKRSQTRVIVLGGEGAEVPSWVSKNISFNSKPRGENWGLLCELVAKDSLFSDDERKLIYRQGFTSDKDEAEKLLRTKPFFARLEREIYPRLRTVQFNFFLHRKGMIKDTIHTTEIDSTYMEGVRALKDMDYKKAVSLLGPYKDYNAAVAHLAMDHNYSALEILQTLKAEGRVCYLLAVLYSRQGKYREAVEAYLRACEADRKFVFRGNLDPEISSLIKRYNLNTNQ